MSETSSRRPVSLTVAFWTLGLVWGSNFMFMKWATDLVTPGQTTLIRVVSGFLPIAAYAVARRALRLRHLRHLHHFAVMSLLATSLYYAAFAAGTAVLPSGIAGALSGSIPLVSALAAAAFLPTERLTGRGAVGIGVGFTGVLLIARPWSAGAADLWGVTWMTAGAVSVGLSFVYARRFLSPLGIPPVALSTYQVGLAALTLMLVVDLDGITALTTSPSALWGAVLGLGLLGTGLAYVLYYLLIERLGAVTAASATYVPPAVSLLIGWLALGEAVTAWDGVALALLLTGVMVVHRYNRVPVRPRPPASPRP